MEEEKEKNVFFRRKFSEIPCMRNTFLYSISSGLGVGLVFFMFTSRVRLARHIGVGTYGIVTLCYWVYCRYNFTMEKFRMSQLQMAMQKQSMCEGTESDSGMEEC